MTEYQLRFIIGVICLIIGIFIGFIYGRKSKDSKTLTALQIVSIGVFFLYLAFTSFGDAQYSDLVAVSILALTGGEPIGKAIAKLADNYSKDKK